MSEELNKNYAHLNNEQLKEELERLKDLTKEVEPIYNCDEIEDIEIELKARGINYEEF